MPLFLTYAFKAHPTSWLSFWHPSKPPPNNLPPGALRAPPQTCPNLPRRPSGVLKTSRVKGALRAPGRAPRRGVRGGGLYATVSLLLRKVSCLATRLVIFLNCLTKYFVFIMRDYRHISPNSFIHSDKWQWQWKYHWHRCRYVNDVSVRWALT